MGVQRIVPLITDKIHKQYYNSRVHERMNAIAIAACEQSKNFFIPFIAEPSTLLSFLKTYNDCDQNIFCDPMGLLLRDYIKTLNHGPSSLCLLVGPEGDLTNEEKKVVAAHGFISLALTETVLRSTDAVLVLLGVVRSFFRN
jgi:16S rRNA (uracil1498-N3)-methyltransferase